MVHNSKKGRRFGRTIRHSKRVPAIFFKTAAENEPMRDWLKAMEFGWPIGMPICRAMGDGLHEVRTGLSNGRIARVFFYVDRLQRLVILHGFIKKTKSTPAVDLELARANKLRHERGLR